MTAVIAIARKKIDNSYCKEYSSVVQLKVCMGYHVNLFTATMMNKNKLIFELNADAVYKNKI